MFFDEGELLLKERLFQTHRVGVGVEKAGVTGVESSKAADGFFT